MARGPAGTILEQTRKAVGSGSADRPADADLLGRYAAYNDQDAFAELVRRHGPLVLGVCRGFLRQEQDAEDAFQATFLVLARGAGSIRKGEAVGSWLYGVARRVAMRAKKTTARRAALERQAPGRAAEPAASEAALRELQALLDDEVGRLPQKLRAPFVLCCLGGRGKAEAARELGWREGTVSSRLDQARQPEYQVGAIASRPPSHCPG
jgi:RNA polymerase sigma factor (sigma-70 family)